MKKIISLALVLVMVLSLTSCGLFSDSSVVKFDEIYTHKDPDGIDYNKRIALKNEKFGDTFVEAVNQLAYPDTIVYDKDGNMIGMYDYDETTGIAKGWTSFETNEYTEYKKGKEIDLGKPDESKMIKLSGSLAFLAVVYGKDATALEADCYAVLGDKADKDIVLSGMESAYGIKFTEESETVLKYTIKEDAIKEELKSYTENPDKVDYSADAYATILKEMYVLREHNGVTYKAYKGITAPEGVDFDESIKLANSGEYAVTEEFASDIKQVTDVVYSKDGKVVAHDSYFEFKTKEAADKVMELGDQGFVFNPERVDDTVIKGSIAGDEIKGIVESYIGYGVLADDTYDSYVKMVEDTYFSVVCE